jgi:hypothetical protein
MPLRERGIVSALLAAPIHVAPYGNATPHRSIDWNHPFKPAASRRD